MKNNAILIFLLTLVLNAFGQVTIKNDLSESTEMSQNLFGAFFEDINYGADGGLYAEIVQNRSFEYIVVPGYTSEGPVLGVVFSAAVTTPNRAYSQQRSFGGKLDNYSTYKKGYGRRNYPKLQYLQPISAHINYQYYSYGR